MKAERAHHILQVLKSGAKESGLLCDLFFWLSWRLRCWRKRLLRLAGHPLWIFNSSRLACSLFFWPSALATRAATSATRLGRRFDWSVFHRAPPLGTTRSRAATLRPHSG